jgi:hypothetical protein
VVICKAGENIGDYHNIMNSTNCGKYLSEKLIRNLEPNTVIVVDNAQYHDVKTEEVPD